MKPKIFLLIPAVVFLLTAQITFASGIVDDYRFFSKALNKEMNCRVYVPEAYDPANPQKRFPVIYFLHGASLGYESYDAIYPILDNLIAFKIIDPVILVLPDGLAPPYNGSFYTNSLLYGNFEDFISHDLVTFIDSALYTRNERGKRGIMGASMGAYGALKIAFRHQELFTGVAGHSGPVNTDMLDIFIPDLIAEDGGSAPYHWSPRPGKSLTNLTFSMAGAFSPNLADIYKVDFPLDSMARPIPAVMERWRAENICEIAKQYHPGANLGITFDCGILDEYHLHLQNRALADTLARYGIPHKYEEYIGTHTTGLPIRVGLSFSWFDRLFKTSGLSIPALPHGINWQVYPNPATNALKVRSIEPLNSLTSPMIIISDFTGRTVIKGNLADGLNTINTTGLPAGMYVYTIQSGKNVQTGKTMIVR